MTIECDLERAGNVCHGAVRDGLAVSTGSAAANLDADVAAGFIAMPEELVAAVAGIAG